MFEIRPTPEGAVLTIRAQPSGGRRSVTLHRDGMLKLTVNEPPEDGKANLAIIELLSEMLGLRRSFLEIVGGKTSRTKSILVRGVSPDELEPMVAALKESLAK